MICWLWVTKQKSGGYLSPPPPPKNLVLAMSLHWRRHSRIYSHLTYVNFALLTVERKFAKNLLLIIYMLSECIRQESRFKYIIQTSLIADLSKKKSIYNGTGSNNVLTLCANYCGSEGISVQTRGRRRQFVFISFIFTGSNFYYCEYKTKFI